MSFKKILLLVFMIVLAGIFSATVCFGQEKKILFSSSDQLKEARRIGVAEYYDSIDRKNGYKIFAGEDTISFPYDVGVKLSVAGGGSYWVAQKAWTVFIFIIKNGERKIIRRYDCRNKISGYCNLPPLIIPPEFPPTISEQRSLAFKPETQNLNIDIDIDINNSGSPHQQTPTTLLVENNTDWVPWAVVGLAVITGGVVAVLLNQKDHGQQNVRLSDGGTLPPSGKNLTRGFHIGFSYGF